MCPLVLTEQQLNHYGFVGVMHHTRQAGKIKVQFTEVNYLQRHKQTNNQRAGKLGMSQSGFE